MNSPVLLRKMLPFVLFALAVGAARDAYPAVSNVIGLTQTQCLTGTDTLVALPFTRPVVYTGSVTAVSNGNGTGTITFGNTPFSANQLVYNPSGTPAVTDHFYLRVGSTATALTGTLALTQNSPVIAGSGTVFTTQLMVGDRLTFTDGINTLTYTVTAISSNTSLTLDRTFADPGATALAGLTATFDHTPLEGRWYPVTANTVNSVTLTLNGDNLSSLAVGTQVSILPYATLNTIFPAANAGTSFTPSTSVRIRQTQILIPDYLSSGINLATSAIYFYLNDGTNLGWRAAGDALTTDHGDDPLLPDGYFIVRQNSTAPTVMITFYGVVTATKTATTLATSVSNAQDNAVGLIRPAGVSLNALGLNPADGSFRASTSVRPMLDQLLIYDNSLTGINKSAAGVYFYLNDGVNPPGWRASGDSLTADHGGDIIPAGSALTIRKAPTATGATATWKNAPNY